jgi:hypothetical protein
MTIKTGFDQIAFVVAEETFGTATDPSGAAALRFSELVMTPTEQRLAREDRRAGSRSLEARIRGRRDVEATLTVEDCPSGTAGTAPDLAPFLRTAYDETTIATTTTVAASPAPTTTGCTMADAAHLATGDVIGVLAADEAGDAIVFAVQVTEVDGNAVSWTPTLPNAPAAGAAIGRSVQYKLAADNRNSATVYKYYGTDLVECLAGAVARRFEYELDAGGVATVQAGLVGKDLARFMPLTLSDAVDDSQTTWSVADVTSDIYTAGRCVYAIQEERVAITATAADDEAVTVERAIGGTAVATHASGLTLTPYQPTPSTSGRPISGVLGRIAIGSVYYHVTSAKVTHNESTTLRNNQWGSATAAGKANGGQREVGIELAGYLTADEDRWQLAHQNQTVSVMLQAGTASGAIHALALPQVELELPAIGGSRDEEVALNLVGRAIAPHGSPETELRHAYL